MLPSSWKPAARPGPLVRLGAAHDGGYPVTPIAVECSDTLLSMGLDDDWRFEEDFNRRSGAQVICFDHTVTGYFWAKYALTAMVKLNVRRARKALDYRRFFSRPDISHRRLMIGYDGPGSVSLSTILAELNGDKIFLKCDIEGGEYRVLDDILDNQRRFTGIVMECHDVDLHRARVDSFIRRLTEFTLVRTHPNNFGAVDPNGDPLVIEFTFIRSDLMSGEDDEAQSVVELPNNPAARDIELAFEPAE